MKSALICYKFWYSYYVPYFPYAGKSIENGIDKLYWKIADVFSKRTEEPMQMNSQTRILLKDYYRPTVRELEKMIGRDF